MVAVEDGKNQNQNVRSDILTWFLPAAVSLFFDFLFLEGRLVAREWEEGDQLIRSVMSASGGGWHVPTVLCVGA